MDCPDIMKPIDGRCKGEYPIKYKTPSGGDCCRVARKAKLGDLAVNYKYIRKLGPIPEGITYQNTFVRLNLLEYYQAYLDMVKKPTETCPDQLCKAYNSICDEFMKESTFILTLYNRSIPLNGNPCKKLLDELPSDWYIYRQLDYINNLSDSSKEYLSLYTKKGDSALNFFIRNNFILTDSNRKYMDDNRIFLDTMYEYARYKANDLDSILTYEEYLFNFYKKINDIIIESPKLDKKIIIYRGMKKVEHFSGAKNRIYENSGILSGSLELSVAMGFSGGNFMSKIIIPKGYNVLLLPHNLSHFKEYEVLLRDQTRYYITKNFQWKKYAYITPEDEFASYPVTTNELVLIMNNINYKKVEYKTRLSSIILTEFLRKAVKDGDLNLVKLLVKNGANADDKIAMKFALLYKFEDISSFLNSYFTGDLTKLTKFDYRGSNSDYEGDDTDTSSYSSSSADTYSDISDEEEGKH
jgi:hypothetical protein